jgi:hypothetical protein
MMTDFEVWLTAVDDELRRRLGAVSADLVFDVPRVYFEGYYMRKLTAVAAAEAAIEALEADGGQ